MALAIFDLDNTLIAGDSDHAWSEFLISEGLVDAATVKQANDEFYQQYLDGGLDIEAYLAFALSYLAGKRPAEVAPLHERFMAQVIESMLLPKAFALIDQHRSKGDTLLVITATNRFVTEPIVARLGIDHLIACEPELIDGCYTGLPTGVPSFAHGKVTRLNSWLVEHSESLAGASFYSDSHNDLPLLEKVDNPVVVNPDKKLLAVAQARNWPALDLR